jgi:eukaryotic-like serine/threonine-protein kinase
VSLSAADVSTLSRLLDAVLDLPPAEIEGWLRQLPEAHHHLRPQLRRLLDERTGRAGFLASVPVLQPQDASLAHAGDLVGPYCLLHEIGAGGMGAVWLAERVDGRLKRRVALKLPRLAWGAGLAERMARERDVGALLEHPNIARLYDAGVDDKGRPFLAMECIDGVPLDQWCKDRQLALRERLRLFQQVARAVAYAHGRLVVHRDLKPSNVLVSADGQAHLLDFGIAKLLDDAAPGDLTQQQGRVLTPHYASPEQIEGGPITVASDVYSLGVLLYELLTGKRPHDAKRDSIGALEDAILAGEPAPASSRVGDRATAKALRGELDAILAKALKRRPGERYATADAFADDVERHLRGERVLARPDSAAYRFRRVVRRHWVGLLATTCVLAAVLGGATVAVVQARQAMRAAERERLVRDFVADVFRTDGRARSGAASVSPAGFVEGGARLIETRFKNQPDLQADLYGLVSGVFFDMGANALAADYANRQLAALKTAKSDGEERARASLRLAKVLLEDGRFGEAERLVRPLVADRGTLRLSDEASILLARTLYSMNKMAELDVLLRRLDQAIAAANAPSTAKAWSQAIRAQISAEGDLAGSAVRFEEAIDTALQAEGAHSTTAVEIRLQAASKLFRNADANASEPFFEAAVAELSTRGGAFANRAAVERAKYRWARARLQKGDGALALSVIEQTRAELLSSPVATPAYVFAQLDFWSAGIRAAFYGDVSALPLLEQAALVLNATYQSPRQRYSVAMDLGTALARAGRYDDADKWLHEALGLMQSRVGRRHPDVSWVYIPIAHNQQAAGRAAAALATLDEADRELSDDGEPRFVTFARDALAATRADVLLKQGHAALARDVLAPRIREGLPSQDIWRQNVDLLFLGETYGEVLCALGRFDEGLRHLDAAIRHRETVKLSLAGARTAAGACALDAGRVAEARRLAGLARDEVMKEPNLGGHFKVPLTELEARLKKRG